MTNDVSYIFLSNLFTCAIIDGEEYSIKSNSMLLNKVLVIWMQLDVMTGELEDAEDEGINEVELTIILATTAYVSLSQR